MSTRTKTNLHVKNGVVLLADLIKCSYSNGTVGIVYEDGEEEAFNKISRELFDNGNKYRGIPLSRIKYDFFEEHIRFILGIGSKKMVHKLQSMVGERRYAFYCTEIAPDYFTNGLFMLNQSSFAEFAYFDTLKCSVKDTQTLKSGYTTLLSLLVSVLDIYCYKFVLPYRDSTVEVIIKELKSILFKPVDMDYYIESMLKIIKNTVDYMNAQNTCPLIYRIRQNSFKSWNYKTEFFIDYLLFYLGLIFTKWNINDMLIPSATSAEANQLLMGVLLKQSAKVSESMLSRDEISFISMVFRAMGESFEGIDVLDNICMIIENCPYCEGLFREINNMGVIESLINYEEHKRY